MPKSRRSNRKPPQRRPAAPEQVAALGQPTAQTTPIAPSHGVRVAARGTAAALEHPFIGTELKGIAIVTVIILVVLIASYYILR